MRPPRLTPAGAILPVLNRAAGRRQLFHPDPDHARSEYTLEHAPKRAARVLRNEFLALPDDWRERINEPLSETEAQELRGCVVRGQPFGSPKWKDDMVGRLRLGSRLATAATPSE